MFNKKGEMTLTCSAIDNTGNYIHYTLSGKMRMIGDKVDQVSDFNWTCMAEASEGVLYEYGKKYKFNFSQG